MKKVGWSSILVATLVLVFGVAAEAQQATKIPRIGYLGGDTARRDAFRQGLRELGYVEGKNIIIEYRSGEEKSIACESSRSSSTSQGGHIVTGGPQVTRLVKEATFHDSHSHGTGYRSCWKRVRRKSCTTRRVHAWLGNSSPQRSPETTGTFKGDRS